MSQGRALPQASLPGALVKKGEGSLQPVPVSSGSLKLGNDCLHGSTRGLSSDEESCGINRGQSLMGTEGGGHAEDEHRWE
jgi:hypothetical protein